MKIIVNNSFKNRLLKFSKSDRFILKKNYHKSEYWKYHSRKIQYNFVNNGIHVSGESGFYIPPKKNFFKDKIKKIMKYFNLKSNKFENTFNFLLNPNNKFSSNIYFNENNLIAKNIHQIEKKYPFKYSINDQIIECYYYLNIFQNYLNIDSSSIILEIGAGNGNLMSLIKYHFKPMTIIDVDLPETIFHSSAFIANLFPEANILLPNEIIDNLKIEEISKYDFIFITPEQIHNLENDIIDVTINIDSFQEMEMSQIKNYLDYIQNINKINSYLFLHNRKEKKLYNFNDKSNKNIKTIKFEDYPLKNNTTIFFETCKFANLTIDDQCFVRLDQIKKYI